MAVGLLAVAAVCVVVSTWDSPTPLWCAEATAYNDEHGDEKQRHHYRCETTGDVIGTVFVVTWERLDRNGVFHAGIAGGTILLALYTARLWRATARVATDTLRSIRAAENSAAATQELAGHAKENAGRELRAHFLPTGAKVNDLRDFLANMTPPSMAAIVDFENAGKTPAYDLQMFGALCVRPYTPTTNPATLNLDAVAYPEFGIAKGIFGPGAGRFKTEALTDENDRPRGVRAPRNDEINGVFTGVMTIFVYGEVRYRDEFGARRWTTYCFIWNRDVERGRGSAMASFQAWNQAGTEGDGQEKPPFCRNPQRAHGAPPSLESSPDRS